MLTKTPPRCAYCNSGLGLISHRYFSLRFCSNAHKHAYKRRVEKEADDKKRHLDYLARGSPSTT